MVTQKHSSLIGNFSRLEAQKILVAGDLLLDTYTIGKARRISPEAPVAVIHVQKQEERAGGAGNAILNLVSMGAQVTALGRIGNDISGQLLKESLRLENVDLRGVYADPLFQTPIKNRIVADNQQIVRVDHENISPLSPALEKEIIESLPVLLDGIKVVAISDYGKGFLTPALLQALIQAARAKGIFIIADPKGTDFSRYAGVHLIKPNLSEAYAAARLSSNHSLDQIATTLLETIQSDHLMITRSEEGISLFSKQTPRLDFPVKAKQVKDVTGAGDTVLAMLAFAVANDLSLPESIELSNVAAGIAIEQFGCARISLHQLAKRLLEANVANKIFDAAHLHTLQAALNEMPCLVITLPGNTVPSPAFIAALSKEKKETGRAVLVSVAEPISGDIVELLASLQPIDFILLDTPLNSISKYFPKALIRV